MESIHTGNNEKTYAVVAEHFKDMILSGRLKEGEKLPSERELSEELGISRATVREALVALEIMGYVNIKKNLGTYVVSDLKKVEEVNTIENGLDTNTSPSDIFETRLIVEPALARFAAIRAKQEELDQLGEIVAKSKEVREDEVERFEIYDGEFHLLIAKASNNNTLYQVSQMINSDRMSKIWGTLKTRSLQVSGRMAQYKKDHEAIFLAIRKRDPYKAEELTKSHLTTIQKHIFEEGF